jgi:uncharacterized membrane protein YdjX (TVP38/TMEM64 family)
VLLLRLVPLLPFNMLNYLLSVTPVGVGEYMLASWLGMMVCFCMLPFCILYHLCWFIETIALLLHEAIKLLAHSIAASLKFAL